MDLNTFGSELIKHVARIANAAEGIEAKLNGGAGKASAEKPAAAEKVEKPTTTKTTPKKEESSKPKHTRDEVNAALVKLKDDCGGEVAKAVIKDVGGVTKMADIPEAKFDEVFAAAEAKHAEMVNSEGDDDI